MAQRPISPRLHGILDYTTGAQLLALPALLRTGGSRSGRALRVAGVAHLAYAALTRYEVGLVKVLPFRAHLALDAAGSAGLVAAPWLLGVRDRGLRHWLPLVVAGLNDAVVTALTDPTGAGGDDAGATSGGTAVEVPPTAPDTSDAAAPSSAAAQATARAGDEVQLSPPDPKAAVMPEGAEANLGMGARTVGGAADPEDRATGGGVGGGAGPGSDAGVGGQTT